jgi:hypothetical protein
MIGWLLFTRTLTGNIMAPISNEAQWARYFQWPWITLFDNLRVILARSPQGMPVIRIAWNQIGNLLDLCFLVFALSVFAYGVWKTLVLGCLKLHF